MNEFNYDIIDQYLRGELEGEALQDFEKQLAENKKLANEVALYKNMDEEMLLHFKGKDNEEQLRNNLQNLNKKHFFDTPKSKVIPFNKWWLATAAAVVIGLIVLVVNPFSTTTAFNSQALYAQYTSSIEALPTVERGNDTDSLLVEATNLYNQKNYTKALPILLEVVSKKQNEKQLLLAAGICSLKTEKLDTALAIFNTLSAEQTVFKDKATWYKALIFLKQNKLTDAYNVLQLIATNADDYEAAKELMEKIKSKK
jgi:hypothetical protein